jgi:hypothetical protein
LAVGLRVESTSQAFGARAGVAGTVAAAAAADVKRSAIVAAAAEICLNERISITPFPLTGTRLSCEWRAGFGPKSAQAGVGAISRIGPLLGARDQRVNARPRPAMLARI